MIPRGYMSLIVARNVKDPIETDSGARTRAAREPRPFQAVRLSCQLQELLGIAVELGTFGAGEFNRRSGIGRNLSIDVLEFFDKIGATRREGDLRHVLKGEDEVIW